LLTTKEKVDQGRVEFPLSIRVSSVGFISKIGSPQSLFLRWLNSRQNKV